MPGSVLKMLKKVNQAAPSENEDEVVISKELIICINTIWLEFNDKAIKKLPAEDFDYLEAKFSAATIVDAKKALFIKSFREGPYWYWSRPRFTASIAIDKLRASPLTRVNKLENRKLQRGSVNTLRRIMKEHRYVVTNQKAMQLMMEEEFFSKSSVMLAKSILGIPSIKKNGVTKWVWACPEVQKWLLDKLSDGPLTADHLFYIAKIENDWEPILISTAKRSLPQLHVHTSGLTNVTKWVDSTLELKEREGQVISVNFEPEELEFQSPVTMLEDDES